MADIVLAVGMSHSPMVVADDVELWHRFGAADRHSPYLIDETGAPVTFSELEHRVGSRYEPHAAPARLREQLSSTKAALERIRAEFDAARPDVVVVIGDDQTELFDASNSPTLAIFSGERFAMATTTSFRDHERDKHVGLDLTDYARGIGMDARHIWPGHAPLAEHMIATLAEQHFDVTALPEMPGGPPGTGVGHAFGIVEAQLLEARPLPLVPVFINCYWPPNQLSAARCHAFGRALRPAIDSFPEHLRVAVVASGGLSHFVVDRELDQLVLEALQAHDAAALASLSPERLRSGNSEIRSWIAVAGTCQDRKMTVHDYVPVYRTAAGTGCGLAFATWGR